MGKLLVKPYKSNGKVLAGFFPAGCWGERRNPVEISRVGITARRANDSPDWWSAYGCGSVSVARSDYETAYHRSSTYAQSIVIPEESEV